MSEFAHSVPSIAVACSAPTFVPSAQALALQLGLPWLGCLNPNDIEAPDTLLYWDEFGPGLQQTGKGAPGRVRVEFWSGKAKHRRLHGGGAGQMVAKAVGIQKGIRPSVVDATAGLGQDAFVLASLGCAVTLLERSPVIASLLHWAVNDDPECDLPELAARMRVVHADARNWLRDMPLSDSLGAPDVIYLDPMFPTREKSALVKKEMRLFHGLIGDDADADELLQIALQRARCRVVVKRPRKAPPLGGPAAAHRIDGQSCRYDIYPLRKLG